jgi:positive regulator of sigma E activity
MRDFIRKALTRTVSLKGTRGKKQIVLVEPNEKLVLLVKFALVIIACLTGLEVTYIVILHSWSSEVFSAITGLIGTVSGVLIGSRA